MKYTWLHLVRKITLISIISVLIFSIASCGNNQTKSPPIETTETPSKSTDSTTNQLPTQVKSAVLSDASKRLTKPVDALRITQAEKQNWKDGCLGLADKGTLCTQAIVPGWKIVVSDGKNELVYRTDEKANQVKLEDSQA